MPASDSNLTPSLENPVAALLAEGETDAALAAATQVLVSARLAAAGEPNLLPELVEALDQLATVREAVGKVAEAAAHYKEALDLAEKAGLGRHRKSRLRIALATLLDFNDQEAEALPLYEQAIEDLEALEPPDIETSGQLRNNVALIYKRQGKFALAEQHYLRAVEALEKTTGDATVEYASLYNNLGSLYYAAGFADQAREVFTTALKLREQLLGAIHPDVAQSHGNIAAVHYELGNNEAAMQSFEAALHILEKNLPEKSASFQATGEDYLALLGSIGEDAKAAELQKRMQKALA